MRRHALLLIGACLSIALGGTALFRSMARRRPVEFRTNPDLVIAPDAPAAADLRLRILYVRRGRSAGVAPWTNIGCRIESPSRSLLATAPFAVVGIYVPRLVLGSGGDFNSRPLLLRPLDRECEFPCGPAVGESMLREAVLDVTVATGTTWDTTTLTLSRGETAEKDFGAIKVGFGPSSLGVDPDLQLEETMTCEIVKPTEALLGMGDQAFVEVRDMEGPLVETGWGMEGGFICTIQSQWGPDARASARIAFPVTVSIHRPRKPADPSSAREHHLRFRFRIRDLPLGRAP